MAALKITLSGFSAPTSRDVVTKRGESSCSGASKWGFKPTLSKTVCYMIEDRENAKRRKQGREGGKERGKG